ncbi:MAG: HAMP domain-containing protein [Saprospiraceae bacterium]|nr:HAMP domain-containing protein [Saprospiraceae bacterium]
MATRWIPRFRIKTKIQAILLFMFAMLVLFGGLAGYYVDTLTRRSIEELQVSQAITKYNSEIIIHIDDILYTLSFKGAAQSFRRINLRKNFDRIESFLNLQQMLTDDPKLDELVEDIRVDVNKLRTTTKEYEGAEDMPLELYMQINYISNLLRQVQKVNEQRTQEQIEETIELANQVMLMLIILGLIFFSFAVFAMIYFPEYIVRPIRRLTNSIREITRKNYGQRLDVRSQDEFGQMAASFNQMAEKLNEFESMNVAQLLIEKKRIEMIIGEMQEAIIGLDSQQTVLFANSTALRLIGMTEEEVVGKTIQQVGGHNELMRDIENEILTGSIQENRLYPALTVHKNGKTYYFEKEILHVEGREELDADNNRSDSGIVIILKNITEFREKDLKKTNLMATVSHELKTPISAIDMSIGLLEDDRIGVLNEEQHELTKTIRQNSSRLLKMVNEILDLSGIESGNISLELDECRAEDLVERALNSTSRQYQHKGVALNCKLEENLPPLKVDIQKTTSVLINFLSNALRYSEAGQQVDIAVRKIPGKLVFTVTDQGPGISPEDQEKIFLRYNRVQNDKTQGTGLGLSIAKEFISKHGGKIWVKSQLGAGSTFGFQLDYAG